MNEREDSVKKVDDEGAVLIETVEGPSSLKLTGKHFMARIPDKVLDELRGCNESETRKQVALKLKLVKKSIVDVPSEEYLVKAYRIDLAQITQALRDHISSQ
jgi:hypothetical protein